MDIRYSCNQKDFKRYTTEEMRDEMLITGLYKADEVVAVYSHVDRMVTLGCMPVHETVSIDKGIDVWANFGTHYFLERREIGMFNIGKDSTGIVVADGVKYELGYKDCLYITKGTKEVTFASADPEHPAKFYMVSAPAHCAYQTRLIKMADANHRPLGSVDTCNKRTINQFIHPDVLKTCQLSMGMTELAPGSNWNTMPSHTHERRMEIYTYFELPEGQVVFHMCGEPTQTRHIVMHNEDAVISPSWSIHSGVGTSNYTFIWAMGGENMEFDDMDNIATTDLRLANLTAPHRHSRCGAFWKETGWPLSRHRSGMPRPQRPRPCAACPNAHHRVRRGALWAKQSERACFTRRRLYYGSVCI